MEWEYRRVTFKLFAAEDISPPGSSDYFLAVIPLPSGTTDERWVAAYDTKPFEWGLNQWGADGWELTAVTNATNPPQDNPWATDLCWFKRPRTQRTTT